MNKKLAKGVHNRFEQAEERMNLKIGQLKLSIQRIRKKKE
jgi:hypothetical protein